MSVERLIESIDQKIKIEDFSGALQEYDQLIHLEPNNALYYISRGRLKKQLRRSNEAVNDLNRAIEISPDDVVAHNTLGLVLMSAGKPQAAIEAFTNGLNVAISKNNAGNSNLEKKDLISGLYNNRVNAYIEQKNWAAALNDINVLMLELEKQPEYYSDLYVRRASIHSELNRIEQAKKDLNQADRIEPNNIPVQNQIAMLYKQMGMPNEARKHYQKVAELAQRNNYGKIYQRIQEILQALPE